MESATSELRALCAKHGLSSIGSRPLLVTRLTSNGVSAGCPPRVTATNPVVKPYVEGASEDVEQASMDPDYYMAEKQKIIDSLPDGVVPDSNKLHAEIARRWKLHVNKVTPDEDEPQAKNPVIVTDELSAEECADKKLVKVGTTRTGDIVYHRAEATDDAQPEANVTAGGKRPASAAMSPKKLAKAAVSSSVSSTASKHASAPVDAEPVAPDVVQATEFGKHVVKRIMQAGVPPKNVLNFIQYFDADYKSATHKTNVKQLVVHLMANYGDDSDDE